MVLAWLAWRIHWSITVALVISAIICIKSGTRILSSWPAKVREYTLLMRRNHLKFKPETFAKYMEAPCGRLLTRVVLKDLGKREEYKNLKKYKRSILHFVCNECKGEPTVQTKITFFDNERPVRTDYEDGVVVKEKEL